MSTDGIGQRKRVHAKPSLLGRIARSRSRVTRVRAAVAPAVLLFLVSSLAALTFVSSAEAAGTTVPLGTAGSFAVLAGAGITNTGATTVTGDIGTYPKPAITGSASITASGAIHAGDTVAQQAQADLVTGYDNAAGQGPSTAVSADLAGQTLVGGVYKNATALGLTGALTLDGQNDPNSVFVFQTNSTLITATGSTINLINGAQACNVFWQVGSSATLGTGSTFEGTIMALTDISLSDSVTVHGRTLARNGAVTLIHDTITSSTCAPQTTTTTSTTAAPSTSSSTTSTSTSIAPTSTSTSTTLLPTTTSTTLLPTTTSTSVSPTPTTAPGTTTSTSTSTTIAPTSTSTSTTLLPTTTSTSTSTTAPGTTTSTSVSPTPTTAPGTTTSTSVSPTPTTAPLGTTTTTRAPAATPTTAPMTTTTAPAATPTTGSAIDTGSQTTGSNTATGATPAFGSLGLTG